MNTPRRIALTSQTNQFFAQRIKLAAALVLLGSISACNNDNEPQALSPAEKNEQQRFQQELITQLVNAKAGDVIDIPAGRYQLRRGLSLNASQVTIRGAGMSETVLSFKGQKQGAEGLLVHGDQIIIEDLAIEDTIGDAIKVNECRELIIRRVKIEWTNGPDENNGSYGLYPVQCEQVLLEDNHVIGASDAGIYVGQSSAVVVRRNRAEFNVAGIEIENTIGADVYENTALDNTGGILVFNLPGLSQEGHTTRVYQNQVHHNNTDNFAPKGTAVASVPAGSGIVINANDKVEIFNNDIRDNVTANVIISSYFSAGYAGDTKLPEHFDPYPETIFIHDNEFSGGGDAPSLLELKALRLSVFGFSGHLPDVLWDGVMNPELLHNGQLPKHLAICLDNGDSGIVNVDAGNGYSDISTDKTPHECRHEPLPAVELTLANQAD
ncbi:MAG: right-handed parallel beta-helix repeat-containing protein [Xanthomonadales bacterium]|nr:right-handed parallel beta-helix repeat-containing protein [Xanthomonadales bacterium]